MTVLLKRCFSSATKAAHIITSPDKLVYPALPSHQYILEGVEKNLDSVLIIDGVTKEETTGARLLSQVGRMANKFKSMGLGRGDHVAFVGLNHLNYLPAKLGVIATGAVPVLFNPLYNAQELSKLLNISECNYAIGHLCSNSNLETIKDKHNLTLLPHLEILDEWAKDESTICPEYTGSLHDTSLMMFSSGTTGLPKSVELTHDNLNSQLASLESTSNLASLVDEEIGDNIPTIVDFLPEFHTYGSLLAQYTVRSGYRRVSLPFFSPEMYLQCIQDHKAHGTTVVPPIMVMLQKLDIVPNYDLSSLRLIIVGAAPLAPETEQAVIERLTKCNPGMNLRVIQGYGCTETSGASMVAKIEASYKAGTVGGVVAGQEIKLLNQMGELCGPHERGEIFIRGPQIMKGYYKNDAANADAFDGEWLRTGDIAYYDEDEDFFIVDRLKEFIKVKGFQVAPAELEAVLIAHEAIADAAVIGIPDEWSGETPKAYVVLPYGVKLSVKEIKDYVASQVSEYKELGAVEFVKSIPKLPSGKIQRKLLREKHAKDSAK